MRSNTDWKRCGCGNIIGLRESCARCASAARARLHAEGIGTRECHRGSADYDDGTMHWPDEAVQDDARTQRVYYSKPVLDPLAYEPPGLTLDAQRVPLVSGGRFTAGELGGAMAKHEPPPVGAEVDYATALRHMQTSPAVRYLAPTSQCPYCWSDGKLMYSRKTLLHDTTFGVDELGSEPWVRVYDASTWPLSSDEYRHIEKLRSELKSAR